MKFDAITVFLNRACPRGCPQCGISDGSKKALSVNDWKKALGIVRHTFDTKFFLFLGTEPLMFKEGLADLVGWLNSENLFYGFYSTSPEPLFSKYRQALIDAGLKNWSAGIDGLPGMSMNPVTEKKVRESLAGLQWMGERGVQTYTLTTVHKQNLHQIVDIVDWCHNNIPNVQSSLNFIEWSRSPEFDFFSPKEQMIDLCWDDTPQERTQVAEVMRRINILTRVEGTYIQVPDTYTNEAPYHYTKLDHHCEGVVGPSIDCDGTMRLCGYSTGRLCPQTSVWELERNSFQTLWEKDLASCPGCHWIFQDALRVGTRILDPKSGYYEERWVLSKEEWLGLKAMWYWDVVLERTSIT